MSRRLAASASTGLVSPAMGRADEERSKRLAEALRQNLRRRKAQARGEETRDETDAGVRKESTVSEHQAGDIQFSKAPPRP